jgi:phenylalanyl-tRNA synthetase beta subunit
MMSGYKNLKNVRYRNEVIIKLKGMVKDFPFWFDDDANVNELMQAILGIESQVLKLKSEVVHLMRERNE